MKYIINTLREFRIKAGLTQQQIAEKLGFKSTDRICRWEKGQTYPHVVNLSKLAKLYGVKMEELYPNL